MNKIFSVIIILILLSITGIVCITKSELHKQLMVVNSEYVFIDEDTNQPPQKQTMQTKPIQKQKEVQKPTKKEIKHTAKPTTKITKEKPQTKTKEIQKIEPKQLEEKTIKEEKKTEQPEQIIEQKIHPQEPIVTEIKELTEEEEIIAWNKWRSDIQNQIMKDTNISAPIGITFKFSFTVDKFGNMSNIKVWSTTPSYSDMAINAIKPVLMSYQRQSILNFPLGTKRVITNVAGGFIMSETTGYSSPSDYSDYERVKK